MDVEQKRCFDAHTEAFGGGVGDVVGERPNQGSPTIPAYLQDTYYWAYLSPLGVALLDHPIVVWTILWATTRGCAKPPSPNWGPATRCCNRPVSTVIFAPVGPPFGLTWGA